MILDDIIAKRKIRLENEMQITSVNALENRIAKLPMTNDFYSAIKNGGISVIAEIKKASPSKGIIRADFDVASIANSYALGGADAMSVLTEQDFFLGNDGNIALAREKSNLPILRKDFIIHPWQVYQTRAIGADAVLLIAACLELTPFKQLIKEAKNVGLHTLVEVHTEEELEKSLEAGAEIIGINNRNLQTFEVTLDITKSLAPLVPKGMAIVSESGIFTHEDIKIVKSSGVDAVLVGESLMRQSDPGSMIRQLKGGL